MTDREMLAVAYGALKVTSSSISMREVVDMIEEHLCPPIRDVKMREPALNHNTPGVGDDDY